MSEPSKSVGLIGCSLAGNAIVERLVRAGLRVFTHELTNCPVHSVVRLGAACLDTPVAVGATTSRVILATAAKLDAQTLLWGANGLLRGPRKPATIIDIDTIDPQEMPAIASRANAANVEIVDATITGSYKAIGHGEGGLIVGGGAPAVAACSDIFDALAKKWSHVGGPGTAANGRMILAVLISLQRSALAEALAHAESLGISMSTFAELVRASPAYSAAADAKSQQMLTRDYGATRRVDADLRDMAAAQQRALAAGQILPIAKLQSELLAETVAAGGGGLDVAALIDTIRRRKS